MNPNQPMQSHYVLSSVQTCETHTESGWVGKPQSRLLILDDKTSPPDELLVQTLELLREELRQMKLPELGELPILRGSEAAAEAGDILIERRTAAEETEPEAYTIAVGECIKVQVGSERGLLYGMRTLMARMLGKKPLPYGIIRDYPVMKERALHIDMGRKYYSPAWMKQRIRELSRLRINTLQLHFSENEGFRLASERHPEVMSEIHWSKVELLDVLEEARKYHVTVIPSLDSPGHLACALRAHPEWILRDRDGKEAKGALDIANPEARAFARELIEEYADVFKDSPSFHIGGDEFIDFENFDAYPQLAGYARNVLGIEDGGGIDAYVDYLNEIANLLERKGFAVRAWNDGLYRLNQDQKVNPKASIQITYWTKWHAQMAPVQTFLDQGHEVINVNDSFFYYVLGENAGYKYPEAERIYEAWHPGLFPKVSDAQAQEYNRPYPGQLVGCSFAIWCDTPSAQTEEEVAAGIREPLLAMAELAWTGEKRQERFRDLQADSAFPPLL
ncbi:beta-N-acetylhexosaminidase [Gorillibacterium sp. sgz500922]|uniref:beta-N-acetylhexosaminidase n=1 Tax=Gorillibacterium sp. sgz500922 TaxID=3446694 RepID=UPI003F664896